MYKKSIVLIENLEHDVTSEELEVGGQILMDSGPGDCLRCMCKMVILGRNFLLKENLTPLNVQGMYLVMHVCG